MLYTTRGIILHAVKYSETSLIVKIYTEKFGLKSYMFRGAFRPKARIRANMLQHLNLVELVASGRETSGIQNPRELRVEHPYNSLPFDIRKSSVSLFINEMLYRSIRHEETDAALFGFIREALIWFDETKTGTMNFHLWFCLHLTRHFGFFPAHNDNNKNVFNLAEGTFQKDIPLQQPYIDPPESHAFIQLLNCPFNELPGLNITHALRTGLIEHIISYYKLHINDFGEIRSHKVLAEVLA